MLNLQIIEEKNGIYANQQEKNILFKVQGKKDSIIQKERAPVNVCFVIDISGSMNDPCHHNQEKQNLNIHHVLGNHQSGFEAHHYYHRETKLSKVKTALKGSLSEFNAQDTVSIVLFSSNAQVLREGIKMTDENKRMLSGLIDSIMANGGTNIYDGWLTGAKEVARKLTEQSLNRVLLLTDGENNQGIQDVSQICRDIAKTNEKNISLSTFGVGDKFNEKFLQQIATAGGGNSYYIEKPEQSYQLFKLELSGLSNLVASKVILSIDLHEGYKELITFKNKNQFSNHDNSWNLTNLVDGQTIDGIFSMSFSSKMFENFQNIQEIKLGKINITYQDGENQTKTLSSEFRLKVKNKADYDNQESHSEFKVQDLLISIAQKEMEVSEMIKNGNRNGALNIMGANAANLESLYKATGDNRLSLASATLQGQMAQSSQQSLEAFSKSMSYSSYSRRTGKL